MPNPMRLVPNDRGVLTLPAYAILDNMLNVPERDYRTFEEMCSFFFGSDTMTVSGLDQIVSNMVRTAVSRRGRVIDDIVYSAQEVQDSLLRVNRACLDRGYDVMKKTMGISDWLRRTFSTFCQYLFGKFTLYT